MLRCPYMEALGNVWYWVFALAGGWLILLLLYMALLVQLKSLKKFKETFYAGTKAKDLESTLLEYVRHIKKIDNDLTELANFSDKVYTLAGRSVHKVGLVRFNPFKDVGGNQSFALALLDRDKTGVVISSLYTREGTRIYAKPVAQGHSLEGFSFTDEENDAISKASTKKIDSFLPQTSK